MNKRKRLSSVAPLPPAQTWNEATVTKQQLLKAVSTSGLEVAQRPGVWQFLLGCVDSPADYVAEQDAVSKAQEMYCQLINLSADLSRAAAHYQASTEPYTATYRRIVMDASRIGEDGPLFSGPRRSVSIRRLESILLAYALTDPPVGYCQGMSDLLQPFLQVYDQDYEAFGAFSALMSRTRGCFLVGMAQMDAQMKQLAAVLASAAPTLHKHLVTVGAGGYQFCFQALLLHLKRAVEWPDVFMLWEALWAYEALEGSGCSLVVHCTAALLIRHRRRLRRCKSMEEVVQFVNGMPKATDVLQLARSAHQLYMNAGRSAPVTMCGCYTFGSSTTSPPPAVAADRDGNNNRDNDIVIDSTTCGAGNAASNTDGCNGRVNGNGHVSGSLPSTPKRGEGGARGGGGGGVSTAAPSPSTQPAAKRCAPSSSAAAAKSAWLPTPAVAAVASGAAR